MASSPRNGSSRIMISGIVDHGARQLRPPLHAAGELRSGTCLRKSCRPTLFSRNSAQLQRLRRDLAARARAVEDVVVGRHPGEQRGLLEHDQPVAARAPDRLAVEVDAAAGRAARSRRAGGSACSCRSRRARSCTVSLPRSMVKLQSRTTSFWNRGERRRALPTPATVISPDAIGGWVRVSLRSCSPVPSPQPQPGRDVRCPATAKQLAGNESCDADR